jgi:type I restriction enzyme S subunit
VLLAGNNAAGDFNVKHYEGKFNAYQRTYVLTVRDTTQLRSRYLYFQLMNALKKFKTMSVGAGTRFLKLGMIQGMNIPLPPLEEQDVVLGNLEALQSSADAVAHVLSDKLVNLAALKSAILAEELQPPQSEAA